VRIHRCGVVVRDEVVFLVLAKIVVRDTDLGPEGGAELRDQGWCGRDIGPDDQWLALGDDVAVEISP
jgi:hypothetical protein